jgi:hypothetical protein
MKTTESNEEKVIAYMDLFDWATLWILGGILLFYFLARF